MVPSDFFSDRNDPDPSLESLDGRFLPDRGRLDDGPDVLRNRLRLEVLPLLEAIFQRPAAPAIARAAAWAEAARGFLQGAAAPWISQEKLRVAELAALPPHAGLTDAYEVRQMAREFGLPTAERAESQDLCFLTQGDYRSFLVRNAPNVAQPGPIVNTRGEVLGQHEGLPFYTVGQRKGINIAARSSSTEALFVLRLDAANNTLVVGPVDQLGNKEAWVPVMHYVSGELPAEPLRCTAKIRYKAKEAAGLLIPDAKGGAHFEFDEPQRDVTPGQGLVCYLEDAVVGGGVMGRLNLA